MSAGATLKLASQISSEVLGEGYEGITTDEIRMRVYIKLKKINPELAERYVYRSNMRVRTSLNALERFETEKITALARLRSSGPRKIAQETDYRPHLPASARNQSFLTSAWQGWFCRHQWDPL